MSEVYLHFPHSRKNFIINPTQIVVAGRAASCELKLAHYFERGDLSTISGQHFKIYKEKHGPHFFMIDTSRNGSEINGKRLRRNEPQKLRSGDIVRLAQSDDFLIRIIIDTEQTNVKAAQSGIYLDKGQFFVDRKAIPDDYLASREKELLHYLYQKAGDVCPHEALILHVWLGGVGKEVVATAVNRLRKKLNRLSPGARHYVETVTGQGYRLQKGA